MSTVQGNPMEPQISDGPVAPVEEKDRGKSQGRLILKRFMGNKLAVVSVILYLGVLIFSISAIGLGPIHGWWKYSYTELNPQLNQGAPTLSVIPQWLGGAGIHFGDHPFGQDSIGKDYFALTMRGIQNSVLVMVIIGVFATFIGVVVGSIAGYFRGWLDALLMRITDVFIVIPAIVIGAIVGRTANGLGAFGLAILLGLVLWMVIARLVRSEFLSLREREFVEAARVAGASDMRIIFKHILPNAVGVIIVAATLLMASAILLETALSYLGFGIKAPDSSLGLLVSQNQSALETRPWLFWWPGAFIVLLALLVNFVGDGLRDAFDPRQRRFSVRRTKEQPPEPDEPTTAGATGAGATGAGATSAGVATAEQA